MIIFKKLRWKNFLSTGNVFTEINLNEHNTTLIVGENGAGKSTMLDALSFALFGKAFRKINKPQLLNSITQKGLVVEVEFSIGSNSYKIIRGVKPTVFEVYQNGNLLNQSAEMKDYQEILEKQIIKVNHKSFSQVVVLGSATFQPFMQLSSSQRRDIIEDLLDLQIFTTMNALLKDKVQLNNEHIVKNNNNRKLIEEKIKLITEHLAEMQSNNEQLINEKKSRIEETDKQINFLNDEYWKYENKRKDLMLSIEDEPKISKRINQLGQLKHKIEAKRALIKEDLSFFKKHDGCPTCKQVIDLDFKTKTVTNKNTELNEMEDALEKLIEQYEETNDRLNGIMEVHMDINNNRMEIQRVKTKTNSLIEYRDSLEEEIKNISKKVAFQEDTKILDLEKEMNDLKKSFNELNDDRLVLTAASSLLKDGGIKARIIKQYVPVINKLINKYLSGMDFFVQFELDEEFNETIKSRFRDEFSYASFSEGEKMRINLAILFTWRSIAKLRNSISTNLLIMDEVFDSSLDSNGTEEFLKILNNLTSDTNTFIISHKTDQLYDKFSKVIKFEKHKNFSKVV
jgi:DNA repair exonuclease SbcCD ATPase subunit